MAPRAPPKRYNAQSPPLSRKSYVEQVESAEVKRSRKAAILQLKMGRLAHVIGIASGLALALTALIAYGLVYWDFLRNGPGFLTILKWMIPLVAGLVVSIVALMIKWEPYLTDRRDAHFIMSIVAIAVPSLIIALIALDELGYLAIGRPDWLYSASLLGISLALISLAMTWEGTSRRRTISIVSAVFPPILLLFPVFFKFENPDELARILPMAYLGSAVAIQLSGSMLHIIASSTTVQQREVLRASDGKLKQQLVELDKKRQALIYREDALRSRESDLEVYEKKLQEELASIDERKSQTVASESEMETRLQQVKDEREKLAKQTSDIENQRDLFGMRQAELDAQSNELSKVSKALAAREGIVAARERDANRLLLDAQSKDRDIKNRVAEVEANETYLGTVRKELEDLQSELSEREKQLGMRETQLDLKGLEVKLAKEQAGETHLDQTSAYVLEQQLLAKQQALGEREISLRAIEDDIRQKSERAARLITRADKQMNELVDKEGAILAREKELAEKEANLKAAAEGLNSQLEEVSRSKEAFSSKEKQYQEFAVNTRTKLSTLETREEEITRKMAALEKREQKIKELNDALTAEKERMNTRLRTLLEKEKDLQAQEAEVGLRHAELKAMERDVLESVDEVEEFRAEAEVPEEDESSKTLEYREKRLMEHEQEIKSRLYQREKELEKKEQSLRVHLAEDLEGKEEAVEEEYAEEKVKTGIERLDDLLMGGMPFGSTVLFVGPPFIGKEVAMLLFLAEGLRKGVPAIVVTTSHPPSEISKEMAPILPTFMELQQLGMVRWIDASGVQDPQASIDPSVISVKGPGDFNGILSALDKCVKDFQKQRQPYFRLAYMSLSLSMTQSNEKEAFQFVQTVAAKVKQAQAVSLFAIERGMHTEQQLESVQHLMTGSVQFKTDKQKTLLSVQGIGDAQTRDWIEYKHSGKALMIGAFSLERIR
jgi:KaiC/GvpD/RAD55 family RecA-like ATPase